MSAGQYFSATSDTTDCVTLLNTSHRAINMRQDLPTGENDEPASQACRERRVNPAKGSHLSHVRDVRDDDGLGWNGYSGDHPGIWPGPDGSRIIPICNHGRHWHFG